MQQWRRKIRVTFSGEGGDLKINPGESLDQQLRIEFSIEKSISSKQNESVIKLWNLSESSRNSIGEELTDVMLEAGYQSNIGILFFGQIRDVMHTRDGADTVTEVTCGDGDKAARNAVISKTYPAGTPVKTVIEGIFEQFEKEGIKKGEWKLPDGVLEYRRPYSVFGACKREMDTLSRSHGFYWSIQNNTMEVVASDSKLPGVVLLTPSTGLIGVPSITDNGVKAEALINPEVRPNRTVKIECETLTMNGEDGEYRVSSITYAGDNMNGKFTMNIHGEALQGGKVKEGKK